MDKMVNSIGVGQKSTFPNIICREFPLSKAYKPRLNNLLNWLSSILLDKKTCKYHTLYAWSWAVSPSSDPMHLLGLNQYFLCVWHNPIVH